MNLQGSKATSFLYKCTAGEAVWSSGSQTVGRDPKVGRQALSRGSPASPAKKFFFTQQRVATIEIVVHWVAKKPEKFKWVSGQNSLGTTDLEDSYQSEPFDCF
jgi:hypothetical protein